MNIVILDGQTTNPGDLSWDPIRQHGELIVYEETHPDELFERMRNADIVITNGTKIPAEAIAATPHVKGIMVLSTGFNAIEIETAKSYGIPVCNVPNYSTPAIAQGVFALLLELTFRIGHHSEAVKAGRWSQSNAFCFWDGNIINLEGLTLGIVGYGHIGARVATIGRAFGMELVINRREPSNDSVALETLLSTSDVVSLHCPLNASTQHLINSKRLSLMKPSAYLINTARGGLIDEVALAEALAQGKLAGAGLDVLSREPPLPDNPLISAPNCIISPHLSWASQTTRQKLIDIVANNIKALLSGTPVNVVNS